jgi:phosphoesterase RecJ-like protein
MSSLTRNEAAQWLSERDHFAILTHRRPDGDTIGSAATLCRGLRQLGKTAHIIENPEITPKYAHLHENLTKKWPEDTDIIVSVDVASPNMLPDRFQSLMGRIGLRIDHHETASSFTECELVEPKAAACAEIIYDVLMMLGATLDKPTAEALYTAVATDTGCFRYANTTAHSYRTAAACADTGANLNAITQAIFETNSFRRLKIQSWMTEHALFFADGQIAICAIPLRVEEEIGVNEDDMENISGFPRTIEGVKIAVTIREKENGGVKASVRAVPGCDAGAICAKFGGGGHKGAAGATLNTSLEDAVQAFIAAMPAL